MRSASSLALIGATGLLAACTSPPPPSSDVPTDPVAPTAPTADMREASVDSRSLDYPALSGCGVVSAGNWTAQIEEGASAGERVLVITGEAGTNPGVDMVIRLDPDIMESDPVQRRARLVVKHPPGDNIDRLDRYEPSGRLAYRPPLGIVRLECEGVLLATITDPEER